MAHADDEATEEEVGGPSNSSLADITAELRLLVLGEAWWGQRPEVNAHWSAPHPTVRQLELLTTTLESMPNVDENVAEQAAALVTIVLHSMPTHAEAIACSKALVFLMEVTDASCKLIQACCERLSMVAGSETIRTAELEFYLILALKMACNRSGSRQQMKVAAHKLPLVLTRFCDHQSEGMRERALAILITLRDELCNSEEVHRTSNLSVELPTQVPTGITLPENYATTLADIVIAAADEATFLCAYALQGLHLILCNHPARWRVALQAKKPMLANSICARAARLEEMLQNDAEDKVQEGGIARCDFAISFNTATEIMAAFDSCANNDSDAAQ